MKDATAFALRVDLDHIAQQCPRAGEILQQCAFLAPRAIPDALFTAASASEVIGLLLEYELIVRSDQAGHFDIHPLLQEAVRQAIPVDQQQERVEQALCALDSYITACGGVRELAGSKINARIDGGQSQSIVQPHDSNRFDVTSTVSHVQRLASFSAEWMLSRQEAAEVLAWAAEILYKQANIQEAEPLLRQALPIWERALGPAHPHIAMVLFNLAGLHFRLKNYPQAEFFAQWSIRVQTQAAAVKPATIIFSLNYLGAIYAEQGKKNEARLCYQKALTLGEKARLPGHPFYAASTCDLAMLEVEQERFAEAEPLLRKVCIDWKLSPDAARPLTIQVWQAFANVSFALEKWEQVEECYQRLLPIYERSLGSEHPETLHCLEQMAIIYKAQMKLDEAKAAMQRILNARERTLPSDSLELASCLNDLAEIVFVRGEIAEAIPLLERARNIYEARPEAEDLTLGSILMSLAAAYATQQDPEQAIRSLERSLAVKTRILGSDHPEHCESLDALALLYACQNRLEEAEIMLQRALAISQRGTETSDVEQARRLFALAQVSLARDLPVQAEEYLRQALTIAQTSHTIEP